MSLWIFECPAKLSGFLYFTSSNPKRTVIEVFTVFNEQILIYVCTRLQCRPNPYRRPCRPVPMPFMKLNFTFNPPHPLIKCVRFIGNYTVYTRSGKFTEPRVENRLPFNLCHVPVQTINFRALQRSDLNGMSSIFYHRITSPDSGVSSYQIVTNS